MVGSRRQPLTEWSDSASNTVKLIQSTPERLPTQRLRNSSSSSSIVEQRRGLYDGQHQFSPSSSVFPTLPSQIFLPPGSALDVSPFARTAKPQALTGPSASSATTHQLLPTSGSLLPRPSKLKHVAVRADKTFSVLDLAHLDTSQDSSKWIDKPLNLSTAKRSHEHLSSYPENDSPVKSPALCLQPNTLVTTPTSSIPVAPQQTGKPSAPFSSDDTTPPSVPTADTKDPALVGGIRVVPKTPDSKKKGKSSAGQTPDPPLPVLPNTSTDELLALATNFSDISEAPSDNYIVYTDKSSSESESSTIIRHPIYPTSPTDSGNYQFIGEDTPSAASSIFGPAESHNSNYELYGTPSDDASRSSSSVALVRQPSQDSLSVPSFRPKTRRSNDHYGYYKSRSRESLRKAASLVSISSVLTQEATRAVFGSGTIVNNSPPASSFAIPGSWAEQALSRRHHMQAHPHQWSSQLSTVLSESDGVTDRGSGNLSSGRRSSGFMSYGSRQYRGSAGSYSSLERPQPAYARNGQRDATGSTIRMVGDQDEDGDRLTDMQDLGLRSSRSRSGLSFFSSNSSDNGRRNSIQSSTSSRANSILVHTLPAWARVYYGSGERRWLAGAPGSSTEGSDSRPGSPMTPMQPGSPNTDHFPLGIYSPRKRPRGAVPNQRHISPLRRSLEITPAPHLDSQGNLIPENTDGPYRRHSRRWRTSSIWSPHLRVDRRATRMSIWEPPSFNWSAEDSWAGRRNVQVVMFVVGFLFPFAWMIAAILPLPPNPAFVMQERRGSEYDVEWSPSYPDLVRVAEQNFRPMDESRYESAKWWRRLNRLMSVVGVLIIGVIIALIILGIQGKT